MTWVKEEVKEREWMNEEQFPFYFLTTCHDPVWASSRGCITFISFILFFITIPKDKFLKHCKRKWLDKNNQELLWSHKTSKVTKINSSTDYSSFAKKSCLSYSSWWFSTISSLNYNASSSWSSIQLTRIAFHSILSSLMNSRTHETFSCHSRKTLILFQCFSIWCFSV